MATLSKRVLKNGKCNYAIQIKIKTPSGKSKFVCTTWKNENNLSGVRAEKAAIAYAEQWEKEYRSGHIHELSMTNFNQFANIWLKTRKGNVSDSYYIRAQECIEKLSNFFGDRHFKDLKAFDIQQFFVEMNDATYTTTKAVIKPNKQEEFDKIASGFGIRKVSSEGLFTRPTLYYARKGEHIEFESAKAICTRFGINVNEYFDKISIQKHYKKESIMKYKRVLSTIYTYAMSIELVDRNFATSAYLKKIIGGEPSKDIDILNENEFKTLLLVLNKHDIWETIPLYLLLTTGMRTCEVCGLEWQDVDFENKVIKLKRNRLYISGKGTIVKELKTKYSKRTIPICNLLYDKLIKFKEVYDTISKNDKSFDKRGAIFCNINGTPRFPHYLNHLLSKYLFEADCKKVSCHKIRHTWITRMISNGVSVNTVSHLAGHATSDITLKIYTHYCPDVEESKGLVENLFKNIC